MRLRTIPKLVDFTAIAFRWLAFPERFAMRHGFALFGQFQPQLPARLRLAVERLRNRSRAAHLAEKQDFHLKVAAVVCHSQHVSNPDLTRSLGGLPVGLNPTEFTGSCGQCSCLESGGPKPLVHSHGGHDLFPYTNGISVGHACSAPQANQPRRTGGYAAFGGGLSATLTLPDYGRVARHLGAVPRGC